MDAGNGPASPKILAIREAGCYTVEIAWTGKVGGDLLIG
jgi:hypothetical protein